MNGVGGHKLLQVQEFLEISLKKISFRNPCTCGSYSSLFCASPFQTSFCAELTVFNFFKVISYFETKRTGSYETKFLA